MTGLSNLISDPTTSTDSQLARREAGRPANPFLKLGFAFFIVLITSLFIGYQKRHLLLELQLDKDHAAFWDVVFKGVAGVVGIATALLAGHKYFEERLERNLIAERDSQQPLLASRQRIYFELAKAISGIMQLDPEDGDDWRAAVRSFWELYWGELPLVSDREVDEAVENYSEYLWRFNEGNTQYDKAGLAGRTAKVLAKCRNALGNNWDVEQEVISENIYRPGASRPKHSQS